VIKKQSLIGKPKPVGPAKERVTNDYRSRTVEGKGIVVSIVMEVPAEVPAEMPLVTIPMGSKVMTLVMKRLVVTIPMGNGAMVVETPMAASSMKVRPRP
jgi:hypothetical protein